MSRTRLDGHGVILKIPTENTDANIAKSGVTLPQAIHVDAIIGGHAEDVNFVF
jgi:hypothetical protein